MKTRPWWAALLALTVMGSAAAPASGQDLPEWINRTKISGLLFGDAYWFPADHDGAVEGQNGFWFRRIYLTFDSELHDRLAFRLRFEAASPGDFKNSTKVEPFVKDAWVRLKWERHDLYLGLSSTPTWDIAEHVWGYRSVEKTPLDLYKMGSSRDFGVALKGRFDPQGKARYHAMVANGSGTKGETNQGKRGLVSFTFYLVHGLLLQAYGDFEQRPGNEDRETLQFFAAWQGERGRLGVLGARQYRDSGGQGITNVDVASVFGVWKAGKHVSVLARFDRLFDPLPEGPKISYLPLDATSRANLVLAGVDFSIFGRFHLIPNLETVFYDAVGEADAPGADVALRTTFFVTF